MLSTKSNPGAFMIGALFGSLVGASVALLYAPRSGEETRTVIKEKGIELKDKAVTSGEELVHKAEEAAGQARTRIGETAEATRKRAAELQERGQVFLDEKREQIKGAIDAGKHTFVRQQPAIVENGVEEPSPES